MRIRVANSGDKQVLIRLLAGPHVDEKEKYSKRVQQEEEYKNPKETIEKSMKDFLSDSKYLVFIAFDPEEALGCIVGQVKQKPHKTHEREGYVEDWCVINEHRSKGVGSALFEKLVAEFRKLGCMHLALDTYAENANAIKIYHKKGFVDRLITMKKNL